MRPAFSWVYELLGQGKSQRAILTRSKQLSAVQARQVKEAFALLKKLEAFDRKSQGTQTALFGIDEVGRGPLAGPLVAACLQLPTPLPTPLPFLRDSKKLEASERELLDKFIREQAVRIGIGVVEAEEFGRDLNLHHLTFLAMERARQAAQVPEGQLLVDGKFPLPSWLGPQKAVVKGDDTSLSIAAASVVAKVFRDQVMARLADQYPEYGFNQHVGYGTEAHRKALVTFGPCPHHRQNFLTKIIPSADTGSDKG